ncbi:MAG: hypothetical protein LBS56_00490 [Propionibacteriaceae bacterium]|jgi:hypothetical protein|nr:hypothetical protein [Propionibacteriaceae bacterium]
MKHRAAAAAVAGAFGLALALVAQPAAADQAVPGSSDIAAVTISSTLNCALDLGPYGQAFNGSIGCGTVVAAHGKVFGPGSLPVGSPTDVTPWEFQSQERTGSGSAGDPYRITTVVIGWGIRVVQTDVFASGDSLYTTTIHVQNQALEETDVKVYRLAQCSGSSYGELDGAHVTCRSAQGAYSPKVQGVQFSGGRAAFFYGQAYDAWSTVSSRSSFSNSVGPGTSQAINGVIGLSWGGRLKPVNQGGSSADFTSQTTFQRPVTEANAAVPVPQVPVEQQPAPAPDTAGQQGSPSSSQAPADEADPSETATEETPDESATPSDSPSAGRPSKAPNTPSPFGSAATGPGDDPDGSLEPSGQEFLTSGWSYAAVGVLGLGGLASATVLRRHGRPE